MIAELLSHYLRASRRALQIQMRHIIKTIVAERHIEQINEQEPVIFLKSRDRLPKILEHIWGIMPTNYRSEGKYNRDGAGSVIQTKLNILLEHSEIFFDGLRAESFYDVVKFDLPIGNQFLENVFIERALGFDEIQINKFCGGRSKNVFDFIAEQGQKNFIVVGLKFKIFECQIILEVPSTNAERQLIIISKRIRR